MRDSLDLKGLYRPTILVVDDSETVLKLVCQLLTDQGYHCEGVTTGQEALEWLRSVTPALILLDYRLPDLNGRQVVEAMREMGQDIPFVVITGHGDESIAVEMMKLGAADYLVKDEIFMEMLPSVARQTLHHVRSDSLLKETEEALLSKEARFVELFDRIRSGVAIFEASEDGLDFTFLDLNEAVERIEGVKKGEVLGRRLLDVFPGAEQMGFLAALRQVWKSGKPLHLPATYYKDEKRQGWRENQIYRLPTGEVVAVYEDISDRRRFEALLFTLSRGVSGESGESFFRSLVNQLNNVLGTSDAFVSELLTEAPLRLKVVAATGSKGIQPGTDYLATGTPCQRVLEEGHFALASGLKDQFPVALCPVDCFFEGFVGTVLQGADGEPLGVLGVLSEKPFEDSRLALTVMQVFATRAASELERQRSEAGLRESERRYRKLYQEFETILNGIPDQISLMTPGLDVIWTNRHGGALREEKETGEVHRHCFNFNSNAQSACEVCYARRCVDMGQQQEAVMRDGEGVFGVKFFPLKTAQGTVHSIICMASDITEKIRLRTEANRANRLASLGEMAAGVAHEINNPNALILLNASVLGEVLSALVPILDHKLEQEGDFSLGRLPYSRMRKELPKIHLETEEAAHRIKRIVEELREFVGSAESLERTVVSLNQIASSAVRLVSQIHPDSPIKLDLGEDTLACGNAQQMEQVVINLVLNAIQALTGKDGRVYVSTFCDAATQRGVIHVRDEGVGISPEILEKITDPFFTTKREKGGTGLGLAVASRIAREHDGTLEFSSTLGQGTDAWLKVPGVSVEGKDHE